MRSRRPRSRQHHKGKKRDGSWHQGPSLARQQEPRLRALAAAEERGARTDAELAEQRRVAADDQRVWQRLDRVAPFVPRFEVAL